MTPAWLAVRRGASPLLLSLPHTGTEIPPEIEAGLVSPWLARKDTDWFIERLYAFAADLDATIIRTSLSRTVIDVNRDPSGASLYPGQATTELCPTTTFDGEPLYRDGQAPDPADRRARWFDPYHAALQDELARLRRLHPRVVLYDAHSIRSEIPRLFPGLLPHFNIGTHGGQACDPALQERIEAICRGSGLSQVSNGRFRGGFITRAYGRPQDGVHAVQMELACRAYLAEPVGPVDPATWPVPYDPDHAAPVRAALQDVLSACLAFGACPP
ncbi:N-formylglutamate amidohydrolase [Methylobacterium sp. 4-46]|uniref:N-formylglutamate deformylase n=1 Tax=unclassified Methylobacterium TaxID=2615210 RepID=UPI000152CB55|nr:MULTISPECIES: N-formylglutamate deformylase [Methylobacterium]ACA16145.1 N-formylglutamate amidohydrolase [Methylobacterium sp. 4-46]WFT81854.1 N-formylglutamate deformylase [Methylobacterium nodulans]